METITNVFTEYMQKSGSLDLMALLSGLLYVLLAANGKRYCWIAGIISCGIIAWQDLVHYKLYADASLQIFYVIVGFWGLYKWSSEAVNQLHMEITPELNLSHHLQIILLGLFSSFFVWTVLGRYTDAELYILDSVTSIFAIIATILLLYKIKSNWLYWIAINACYIYIYARQEAHFFALLSILYLILAIYGYFKWTKKSNHGR